MKIKRTFSVMAAVMLAGVTKIQAEPIPIEPPGQVIIYQRTADPANVYPNARTRNYRPRFYRPEFYRPEFNARAFPRSPYYTRQIGPIQYQTPAPQQ